MASVNRVTLIGNLGRDPESRSFPNGDMVCNVTIATTESWNDKATGEKKSATEWHRVVFTRKLAEIAQQYLRKGSSVYVEGSLKTRKWTDKDGQERYQTEIQANSMQMLGGKPEGQQDQGYGGNSSQRQPAPQRQAQAPVPAPQQRAPSGFDDMDDDIPFIDPMRRSLNLYNAI